ncbi:MAG TPA: hypothetical protein VK302_03370 [Terriglobales bacterium]|nr:hypothetical protein [Terriglobales bacterium]
MMIPRVAKARLLDLLQRFPAVALLGPRHGQGEGFGPGRSRRQPMLGTDVVTVWG